MRVIEEWIMDISGFFSLGNALLGVRLGNLAAICAWTFNLKLDLVNVQRRV